MYSIKEGFLINLNLNMEKMSLVINKEFKFNFFYKLLLNLIKMYNVKLLQNNFQRIYN